MDEFPRVMCWDLSCLRSFDIFAISRLAHKCTKQQPFLSSFRYLWSFRVPHQALLCRLHRAFSSRPWHSRGSTTEVTRCHDMSWKVEHVLLKHKLQLTMNTYLWISYLCTHISSTVWTLEDLLAVNIFAYCGLECKNLSTRGRHFDGITWNVKYDAHINRSRIW